MDEDDGSDWFLQYCQELEEAVGRGWKRRLAEKVGVAETNVQTWLKSGRVPPAVRRAITLADRLEEVEQEYRALVSVVGGRWIGAQTVGNQTRYCVHEMDTKTGVARLVAGNIARIEDARELANLPAIRARIERAVDMLGLDNMYDGSDDQQYVRALREIGWAAETPWERRAALNSSLLEQ